MNPAAQDKLRELRQRLADLEPYPWEPIEAWSASARPLLKAHYGAHFDDFELVTTQPKWHTALMIGTVSSRWSGPRRDNFAEASARERHENQRRASAAKDKILAFLDGLLDLPPTPAAAPPQPSAESPGAVHHYHGPVHTAPTFTSTITGSAIGSFAQGERPSTFGTVMAHQDQQTEGQQVEYINTTETAPAAEDPPNAVFQREHTDPAMSEVSGEGDAALPNSLPSESPEQRAVTLPARHAAVLWNFHLDASRRRSFVVDKSPFRVGRHEPSDLVIEHSSVSKVHATLQRDADGFTIIDTGSTNGTTVNGLPVSTCALRDGDSVGFGWVEMRYGRSATLDEARQMATEFDNLDAHERTKTSRRSECQYIITDTGSHDAHAWRAVARASERDGQCMVYLIEIDQSQLHSGVERVAMAEVVRKLSFRLPRSMIIAGAKSSFEIVVAVPGAHSTEGAAAVGFTIRSVLPISLSLPGSVRVNLSSTLGWARGDVEKARLEKLGRL